MPTPSPTVDVKSCVNGSIEEETGSRKVYTTPAAISSSDELSPIYLHQPSLSDRLSFSTALTILPLTRHTTLLISPFCIASKQNKLGMDTPPIEKASHAVRRLTLPAKLPAKRGRC